MPSTTTVSVVIVTYNAKKFISFCLDSIQRSTIGDQIEIIVVDNDSTDKTASYIVAEYPNVIVISNRQNVGFSKACNQGAKAVKGDHLLFLNPDCIVEERAIEQMLSTIRKENVGVVGPFLLDGGGRVLPESAREIPTTKGGIAKILNLPLANRYPYYKNLVDDEAIIAPVLCGACMLIKTDLFDQLEGFDEDFFMYGEDIDLSVRVLQLGLNNICDGGAKVIHFKGESTNKKLFFNNKNFYNAINIYVSKHALTEQSIGTEKSLGLATSTLSLLNYCRQSILHLIPLIIDFILIVFVLFIVQFAWSIIKSGEPDYYGVYRYFGHYMGYGFVWILMLYIQGVYFNNLKTISNIFKSGFIGGLAVLLIYSILPEGWRFSRMIVIIAIFFVPVILSMRYYFFKKEDYEEDLLIIGDGKLDQSNKSQLKYIKYKEWNTSYLSRKMSYVFDFSGLRISQMVSIMMSSRGSAKFEFWDKERAISYSSNLSHLKGESADHLSHYNLSKDEYLLHKRLFDIGLIILLIVPLILMKILSFRFNFQSVWDVLIGRKTIVGYDACESLPDLVLPMLGGGIVNCYDKNQNEDERKDAAISYARDYGFLDDVFISLTKIKQVLEGLV